MRILWVAGWYPTTNNKYSGNFVQRHFEAVHRISQPEFALELVHFAIYQKGEPIPSGINAELQHSEHIIPVLQDARLPKFINALYYYASVLKHLYYLTGGNSPASIVHVHAADKVGIAVALLKRIRKFNLWATEHWAIFGQPVNDRFENRSWWFKSSYRWFWNAADVVASINNHLYEEMKIRLGSDKLKVLFPNVLDVQFLRSNDFSKDFESDTPKIQLLHISNGEPRKNVGPLVLAFEKFKSQYPEAQLTLIGSEHFDITGNQHGLTIIGKLTPQELKGFYVKSDALILVSDAENAPCVITEAHCCGLPVIVTQVGGIQEMCDETNSIQIPAFQTPEEKAEKIYDALLLFVSKWTTFDSVQISKNALLRYHPAIVAQGLKDAYLNQTCAA